jgi:hypothetical protein
MQSERRREAPKKDGLDQVQHDDELTVGGVKIGRPAGHGALHPRNRAVEPSRRIATSNA